MSAIDIIKKYYKQIPKDKCVAGGGKYINTVVDTSLGYCLCPEGQYITDATNPKCTPMKDDTPYDPYTSGFYRDGISCKEDEKIVTQQHPWNQTFGESACIGNVPSCAKGFQKQQLRYGGEVLDYCIRKDAKGEFVSSYYPTTFLIRPPKPAPASSAPVPTEKTTEPASKIPTYVWYIIAGVGGVIILALVGYIVYYVSSRSKSTPTAVRTVPAPTPVALAPSPSPAIASFGAVPPIAPATVARGGGRKLRATRRK